jgi:hypothetical protein
MARQQCSCAEARLIGHLHAASESSRFPFAAARRTQLGCRSWHLHLTALATHTCIAAGAPVAQSHQTNTNTSRAMVTFCPWTASLHAASCQDSSVFAFNAGDEPCHGLDAVLWRYRCGTGPGDPCYAFHCSTAVCRSG